MNTAKRLLKLSVTHDLHSPVPAHEWDTVPAHGKRTFTLQPNCGMTVERVEVYPKGQRMTLIMPDPTNLDTGYSPVRLSSGGVPETKLLIHPDSIVTAFVENPTDRATHARVVLTGLTGHDDSSIFAMSPSNVETKKSRRIPIPPSGRVDLTMQPPVRCRVQRIAVRSDSDGDVTISEVQFSNVNLLVGMDVPVEYFGGDGAEISARIIDPSQRIRLALVNLSSVDRWVEIDLHADTSPVAEAANGVIQESRGLLT